MFKILKSKSKPVTFFIIVEIIDIVATVTLSQFVPILTMPFGG